VATGGEGGGEGQGNAEIAFVAAYGSAKAVAAPRHLRMVKIKIRLGSKGRVIETTCLLDSGNQRTLIDEDLARKLGATLRPEDVQLSGIHGGKCIPMALLDVEIAGQSGTWHQIRQAAHSGKLADPRAGISLVPLEEQQTWLREFAPGGCLLRRH